MLDPELAVDRIVAAHRGPPGVRALHAKGRFYSGTFNASPDGTAICRALHFTGETVPILVRWSNGSGRPGRDDRQDVRGMAISFVLPDSTSTDLVAQTAPRFPVRTPDEFVRLLEITRDRKELAKFLATRPGTARALYVNHRAGTLKPPRSYAEATYYPIHAYRWLTGAGHGSWVRYRFVPQAADRRRPTGRFHGDDRLQDEMAARLQAGPVSFDLVVTVAGPKDNPHDPMSVWKGSRDFVAGWLEITGAEVDHEADGDVVVFDPTRVVDGIELSDDPILRYRARAYAVSVARRTPGPR
jgi:catalase